MSMTNLWEITDCNGPGKVETHYFRWCYKGTRRGKDLFGGRPENKDRIDNHVDMAVYNGLSINASSINNNAFRIVRWHKCVQYCVVVLQSAWFSIQRRRIFRRFASTTRPRVWQIKFPVIISLYSPGAGVLENIIMYMAHSVLILFNAARREDGGGSRTDVTLRIFPISSWHRFNCTFSISIFYVRDGDVFVFVIILFGYCLCTVQRNTAVANNIYTFFFNITAMR